MSQHHDPTVVGVPASLVHAMAADGVRLTDRAAVAAWLEAFKALPVAERLRLAAGRAESLAPMRIPDVATLAAAALDAPVVRQVSGFLAWVGEVQALTPQGLLDLADGKHLAEALQTGDRFEHIVGGSLFHVSSTAELVGLDLVFRLSLEAGLVHRQPGAVRPTERGARFLQIVNAAHPADAVLALWQDLVAATLRVNQLGEDDTDADVWSWLQGFIDLAIDEIPRSLGLSGNPMLLRSFARATCVRFTSAHDLGRLPPLLRAMLPDLAALTAETLADRLEWLGIVTREDTAIEHDVWGDERRVGGMVRLAPLGNWYVRPLLVDDGHEVPVLGDHVEVAADELLGAIAAWPPDAFGSEVRAWARRRAAPCEELVAAARAAADPARRQLAFTALAVLGDEAEPTVRALGDDPLLRPFADVWLVDQGYEEPRALDGRQAPDEVVRILASVLVGRGSDALRASGPAQDVGAANLRALEQLWRVDDPYTGRVLEVLSTSPVREVAKAARRGLFKHRNSATDQTGGDEE